MITFSAGGGLARETGPPVSEWADHTERAAGAQDRTQNHQRTGGQQYRGRHHFRSIPLKRTPAFRASASSFQAFARTQANRVKAKPACRLGGISSERSIPFELLRCRQSDEASVARPNWKAPIPDGAMPYPPFTVPIRPICVNGIDGRACEWRKTAQGKIRNPKHE
jgi:hypothetical protein